MVAGATCLDEATADRGSDLALRVLRYSLGTHKSGHAELMDGDRVLSIKGLFLQIANDLLNGFTRTYTTEAGRTLLRGAEGG